MQEGLSAIEGRPPDLARKPPGCPFHPRCAVRLEICTRLEPDLTVNDGRSARCWLLETETDLSGSRRQIESEEGVAHDRN
jgi:ABC-type dipeptide/oligopeptide/nickel transport system ATPase component